MDFSSFPGDHRHYFVNQNKYFMTAKSTVVTAAISTFFFGFGSVAWAQDGPGTRAAGMGGAFVAVADDASAVYWNPAGFASGPIFSAQIDFGATDLTPGEPTDPDNAGGRRSMRLFAFGVPALGGGYYRLNDVHVAAPSPAVQGDDGREDLGLPAVRLTTSHFGLSLLQSVGGGVALGTTLKLVRGSLASGSVSAGGWSDVLDRADDLEGDGRTRADLDVGVMLNAGRVRIGLVGRNLREPSFAPDGVDEDSVRLEREFRLGLAWGSRWPGITPLVVSFDADLTRVDDLDGERRDVAAGAETWWLRRRVGVRGGWRASTVGDARPIGTAGISIAARSGIFVDAHIARGRNDRQSWSVGGRFTY